MTEEVGDNEQEVLRDGNCLRLEVVDLGEDGTECTETNTEENHSKSDGREGRVIVDGQDLEKERLEVSHLTMIHQMGGGGNNVSSGN